LDAKISWERKVSIMYLAGSGSIPVLKIIKAEEPQAPQPF
jgi:hypothetical protein